jgi:hypothetical protein
MPSPSKALKLEQTVERRQKKQKRKAEEGKLHLKRQEMDKAKVDLLLTHLEPLIPYIVGENNVDYGCRQALLLSSWSNGIV